MRSDLHLRSIILIEAVGKITTSMLNGWVCQLLYSIVKCLALKIVIRNMLFTIIKFSNFVKFLFPKIFRLFSMNLLLRFVCTYICMNWIKKLLRQPTNSLNFDTLRQTKVRSLESSEDHCNKHFTSNN